MSGLLHKLWEMLTFSFFCIQKIMVALCTCVSLNGDVLKPTGSSQDSVGGSPVCRGCRCYILGSGYLLQGTVWFNSKWQSLSSI